MDFFHAHLRPDYETVYSEKWVADFYSIDGDWAACLVYDTKKKALAGSKKILEQHNKTRKIKERKLTKKTKENKPAKQTKGDKKNVTAKTKR